MKKILNSLQFPLTERGGGSTFYFLSYTKVLKREKIWPYCIILRQKTNKKKKNIMAAQRQFVYQQHQSDLDIYLEIYIITVA